MEKKLKKVLDFICIHLGHNLYRFSKGIKKPKSLYLSYDEAKRKISSDKLTFQNTLKITTDNNFQNTIHYEYYNSKR